MTRDSILSYRVDFISIVTVLTALCAQIAALLLSAPWWCCGPIILLLRAVNVVEHNHAHVGIFGRRWLDDAFGALTFLSNGVPLTVYELHHVKNHHRNNQKWAGVAAEDRDWSSLYGFSGARYPDKPVGKLYYVLTFPFITIATTLVAIARMPGTPLFHRYLREATFVSACIVAMLAINPAGFTWFFLGPWIVVFFGLGFNNYGHHAGCKIENPYHAATVQTRAWYSYLGFNIGLHVSHHKRPSLHWSLLPEMHAQIAHRVPPENFRPRRSPKACQPTEDSPDTGANGVQE